MENKHILRQRRTSIDMQPGCRYNITFDTDFLRLLAEKDKLIGEREKQAVETFAALLRVNEENTWLKSIIRELTGEWVDDPADYWSKHF